MARKLKSKVKSKINKVSSSGHNKRDKMIEKKVKEIMKRSHMSKDKLGQITVRRIGKKYGVNISGTPEEILSSAVQAYAIVNELRRQYGRRTYDYFKNRKYSRY